MIRKTSLLICTALGAALMVVGAYVKFPIPGLTVQFTTQVFFMLTIGLTLPFPYGSASILCYIALGLVGLPVFSRGGGLHTVFTPEFGYLLGFVFATAVMGLLRKWLKAKPFGITLCAMIGVVSVYIVAIPYIALIAALYTKVPLAAGTLFSAYFLAFLPMDILKAVLAALVARQLLKAIPQLR